VTTEYNADLSREVQPHLARIQELCREYPTQAADDRKMSFASIRIAADAIVTLGEDYLEGSALEAVRDAANDVHAEVDKLADRSGDDSKDRCSACGAELHRTTLPGSGTLEYCTRCPERILEAVGVISDATGADIL